MGKRLFLVICVVLAAVLIIPSTTARALVFNPGVEYETGVGPNSVALGDLDADGRDELVAGRGPDPGADTEVKVFTYDGVTINQWLSLEAFSGLTHGTNVPAGKF